MSPDERKNRAKDRIQTVGHAFRGIRLVLFSQPNARIHLGATLAVLIAGWLFRVERWEWAVLLLAIAIVWVAEALNSAAEFLTDLVSPDYHSLARHCKDAAAGAVLIGSILAVCVGLVVFVPKVLELFRWNPVPAL